MQHLFSQNDKNDKQNDNPELKWQKKYKMMTTKMTNQDWNGKKDKQNDNQILNNNKNDKIDIVSFPIFGCPRSF